MSNIEKKLDALIDALGFDVKRVCDIEYIYKSEDLQDDGEPKEYALADSIIDNSTYKLTKRKDPLDVLYCGITLRELTNNVMCIQCDPTLATNDKWIAYKKDAYEAVLCWFEFKMHINKDVFSFKVFDVQVILDE